MLLHFACFVSAFLAVLIEASYPNETTLSTPSTRSPSRRKRIVWGEKVVVKDSYKIVQYQASITSAHYCNEYVLSQKQWSESMLYGYSSEKIEAHEERMIEDMVFQQCPIDAARAYCGGAAITPRAVQTACNCIARFDDRYEGDIVSAIPYNGWEDMVFIFVGALTFHDNTTNIPYISKRFVIHEYCREVSNFSVSHNFGIVVLRYPLVETTVVAPVVTMSELQRQYEYVTSKEAVCMYVGWGSVNFVGFDIYGPPSYDLQQTWRAIRSYLYCFFVHSSMSDFFTHSTGRQKLNYKTLATWSCSTVFGRLRGTPGFGDSGNPMSCVTGWYFGVANWAATAFDLNLTAFSITTDSDLAFSKYENSYEYRRSFNDYISGLSRARISQAQVTRYARDTPGEDFHEPMQSTIGPNHALIRPLVIVSGLFLAVINLFI